MAHIDEQPAVGVAIKQVLTDMIEDALTEAQELQTEDIHPLREWYCQEHKAWNGWNNYPCAMKRGCRN